MSQITNEEAEMLSKILSKTKLNDVITFTTELNKRINLKENDNDKTNLSLHYKFKEDIIQEIQVFRKEFSEAHYDFIVDLFQVKKDFEYYLNELFSLKWSEKICNLLKHEPTWIVLKTQYKFSKEERFKKEFPYTLRENYEECSEIYINHDQALHFTNSSCVYVLRGCVNGKYMYKIGKTTNLKKRFSQLQKEYDFELIIAEVLTSKFPSQLESSLHKTLFNERRFVKKINGNLSNEWFDVEEKVLYEFIEDYIVFYT